MAIGIDTFDKAGVGDGEIDRVYLLQAFGPKPSELPRLFETATVLETESGIRLVVPEEKLDVRLELASGPALFGPQGGDEAGATRYRGFGLARVDAVRLSFPLEPSWLESFPPVPLDLLAAAACSSGGAGATSCSVTNSLGGCSISCSTGFYACCINASFGTAASCSCNTSGGGGGGGAGGGTGNECTRDRSGFCDVSCMFCTHY